MFGRNFIGTGQRRGTGFMLRGSSPPWPYVGRGRGGLPRCSYYADTYSSAPTQTLSHDNEMRSLKDRTESLKRDLASIESRLQELQKEE